MEGVCLDSNVLIWLMRRPTDERERALREKANFLVEQLERNKEPIVLPSVVVAEFLVPIGAGERLSAVAALDAKFKIVPFDAIAAVEFARLPRTPENREKNKFDRMIVATALAAKVRAIYSEDSDVHAIGASVIEVNRLPSPPPTQFPLLPGN